jgi:hypothetical protein
MELSGKRIGFLEVIARNENDNRHGIYWTCRCHCPECTKRRNPKFVSIRQDKLINGRTKSCGYNKDLQETRRNKNTNSFELTDDYYIGYTYKNEEFYFDKEDYELVISVSTCWSFNDGGYLVARDMRDAAERYDTTGGRKLVYLKDIVMKKNFGEKVVYVNKLAKYDNRKSNLKKEVNNE